MAFDIGIGYWMAADSRSASFALQSPSITVYS